MSALLDRETNDPVAKRLAEIGQEFGHGHALELERIEACLNALGRPHEKLPPVIHVAGTNGKGSVCAYLRAICEAAGLRAHVFTSPHLVRVNERVRVAGKLASDAQFLNALDRIAETGAEVTYFEAVTAAAFLMFAETPGDLVILETGLGGRVDATNVVNPAVSVIAPVDLDHAQLLGDTIALIAREKAGILKPARLAVIARQLADAEAVIEARAGEIGAELLRCGSEWDAYASSGRLLVQTEDRLLDLPLPSLIGPHQVENAGLAVRAVLALNDARYSEDAIARGIASAKWPARMQALTGGSLVSSAIAQGAEVWLDGGHNPHAARALAGALDGLGRRSAKPVVLIVGMLSNKDLAGFLAPLKAHASKLIAVPVHGSRASREPEDLAQEARTLGFDASAVETPADAIAAALEMSPAPPRILICGSLYLAGEVLALSGLAPD